MSFPKSKKKENVLKKVPSFKDESEITLLLDSYDDIFSDFDPRPNSKRALSQDFLEEAKRASLDKISPIHLEFLLNFDTQRYNDEKIIKIRLHEHFLRHHHIHQSDRSNIMKTGFKFFLAGIFIMLFSGYFLYSEEILNKFIHVILILFEPAGWFFFWEGLNLIFFESKKNSVDYDFYKKMMNSKISFNLYHKNFKKNK